MVILADRLGLSCQILSLNIERMPLSGCRTYHTERIDNDGIKSWAYHLVRDLKRIMDYIRPESEFLYLVCHPCLVIHCVNEQNVPVPEWCHFCEHRVYGLLLANLGCDSEKELAALADLTFDPHASGHEGNKVLQDGQP